MVNNSAARTGPQPLWQNRLIAVCYTVFRRAAMIKPVPFMPPQIGD